MTPPTNSPSTTLDEEVDAALTALHESDASMAAIAEQLGQLGALRERQVLQVAG